MTAKAEIAKLRRTYFACLKALGLDEDARHAFNASFIGLTSTKKWTLTNWRRAVAELQRQCGMDGVEPGQPHIKRPAPDTADAAGGDWATAAQVAYIERLAAEIHWKARSGLQLWIRKRVVDDSPTFATNWSGRLEELPRSTATQIINRLSSPGWSRRSA